MPSPETLPPAAPAAATGASVLPTDGGRPHTGSLAGVAVLFGLVIVGAGALLFAGRFRELYALWTIDDNYSHGFLVPVVSVWLAWEVYRRQGLTGPGNRPAGLVWLGVGCVLHLWAVIIWWPPMDFLALATLLYGAAVLVGGRRWAQGFLFPILFLFFMFPLSPVLLNEAAVALQGPVTAAATWLLQLFVPAYHVGSRIFLPGQQVEVGDQCSGLRQIMAFAPLTLLVAYLSRRRLPFRLGIVLAGVPVAIAANLLRVLLMALLTLQFGPQAISQKKTLALGVSYHTAWGLLTYGAGLGLLLAVAWWLGRVFPQPKGEAPEPPAAPPAPRPVPRGLVVAAGLLLATFGAQWLLENHLAAGQERTAAARYFTRPLQGAGGFPVTLAEPADEATGDPVSRGAWSGKEATPDPAALPYYNDAQDRLSRAYVREEDGRAAGPQCLLWMVHFRDGRDRQHHPLICCKVAGCTENSAGHEAVQLEGPGSPAQRFCFTRDDDPGYLSYVYYWHYTFEAPEGLSPLQQLHAAWAVRPSLTVEVFTSARTPQELGQAEQFVRLVDRQLKSHLPPGARRGSEALPITARR